jgi:hypothetical protein
MHIRPKGLSKQHELLLDLEGRGQKVYYVGPLFHTMAELNRHYLSRRVRSHSFWLKPSQIGHIRDLRHHYVAYVSGTEWHFCSTPRRGVGAADFSAVEADMATNDLPELTAERLAELAAVVREVALGSDRLHAEEKEQILRAAQERPPLQQAAMLSQFFLDAQLFIASSPSEFDAEIEASQSNPGVG